MKTKLIIIIALGLHLISPFQEAIAQSCTQNNIFVERFTLRDANGNPFSPNDNYEIGEPVTGQIFVRFSGNSTNAYSLKTSYDIYVNGVLVGSQNACLFNQQQIVLNTPIYVNNFTWNWGDVVEVRNVYIRWSTNANTPCSSVSDGNSQCYYSAAGFIAAVPLFPNFDYAATFCNPFVQFEDLTVGGYPPYTYSWNFGGLGGSTAKNPSFSFPDVGSYSVTLNVTDNSGTVRSITNTVTIPTIAIQVEITPTKINQSNGSIRLDLSGGNAPYTINWQSTPSGNSGSVSGIESTYTINNLPSGEYQITVTDAQGCVVVNNYTLEWTSILSQKWDLFEAKVSQDKTQVEIEWVTTNEKYPSIYYIERSIEGISKFEILGSVEGFGFDEGYKKYRFVDNNPPRSGGRIYYRIMTIDQNKKVYVSKVISVLVPEIDWPKGPEWTAFPNPIIGNKLTLKHHGSSNNISESFIITISTMNGKSLNTFVTDEKTLVLDDLARYLPKGILLIEIFNGSKKEYLRVIKR